MQSTKFSSPEKPPQSVTSFPSQTPSKENLANQSNQLIPTRRIWIRKPDGTPTSLQVKESAIIDDLKVMIIDRFPTTLAKLCDPSDIIIDFDPSIRVASPGTPAKKFFSSNLINDIQQSNNSNSNSNSNSSNDSNFKSPLSPIPIVAKQYSFDQPSKTLLSNFGNLSIRSNSPRSIQSFALEPDKSVWQLLDTFFPNGMSIENAFIVTLPHHIHQQLISPYSSTFSNNQQQQPIPIQNRTASPFSPMQKKSFSTETIAEAKEEDHHDHRRLASLPNQHGIRSQTPSNYRRSFSSSADQQHSSAVLLIPSSSQSNTETKRISTGDLESHNNNNKIELSKSPESRPSSSIGSGLKKKTSELSLASASASPAPAPTPNSKAHLTPGPKTQQNLNVPVRPISRNHRIGGGSSAIAKVLPSINVLIVEDNLVNSRILSAHLRRHGIHYDTAKNGKEAIEKWRKGGFHLVLMDIQLPVMSGLDASKEIRRLEKLNHIGVFAKEDLQNLPFKTTEDELDLKVFRSPIIIVALTASTLKQDKQEALASGCNDYLTKPVNLDWLLNKITEWGCMQALIDFDGWKSGERMTNISAAIPTLTRKTSSRVK